ncbi:MAG: ADP-glyceromanno-heptose 6-epimerase [Flavobacteriales bacterium]|nr:ADP-glyceromanno-heptose 6-epimerase [Flavobacteriales bacterium]
MIVITGAAGFIGSCLAGRLNEERFFDLVLVDDFSKSEKLANYTNKRYKALVDRSEFFDWLDKNEDQVQFIFHLGARTDTTEFDHRIFDELNVAYSQRMWQACVRYGLPLVYASSAATYGLGEHGFRDDHALTPVLAPLNPYGVSKNEFDRWALNQKDAPFFWAGLKFFNVYGPNEYHKGRMASVIFHAFNQISATGGMKLFRSHNPDYADGGQKRDFVYVKDVAEVCVFLMHLRKHSGIYNLGSGVARTFNDLARSVFSALELPPAITYIDTPADIRDKYQYFTEADMGKLISAGYTTPFHSLEEGVKDYVVQYLKDHRYW